MCSKWFNFIEQAGAIEGQMVIAMGRKIDVSIQELLDCSRSFGNSGCLMGTMLIAYKYAHVHGFSEEISYPYIGKNGVCRNSAIPRVNVKLLGYKNINRTEYDLKVAVGK